MNIEQLQRESIRIIRRYLPDKIWQVWLFGSRAGDQAADRSDLDLAIVGPQPVPPPLRAKIRAEVEELPTLRSVDVIDLGMVGDRFRAAVMREGRRID